MSVEQQLTDTAGRFAQDVGGRAVQETGGFVSSLLMSPINLLGTMARQGFSGIMSWGLPAAAVLGGTMLFAPDLFRGAGELFNRTGASDALGGAVAEGGPMRAIMIALGGGAAVGGTVGMLSGAWQSLTGGGTEEAPQSTGASLGRTVGTVATFAAVAAVAIGAVNNVGIAHDAGGERDVTPPPVPNRTNAGPQATV